MTPEEMQEMFGGRRRRGRSVLDFFHTFFGGRGSAGGAGAGGRSGRMRRGQDLDAAVDLTLEEAFRGTTRRVAIGTNGSDHARWRCAFLPA